MKPGVTRPAARKTWRVAAVFTGAAALGAGYVPAATAATPAPAERPGHSLLFGGKALTATGQTIHNLNCASHPTAAHVWWKSGPNFRSHKSCFGFTGSMKFAYNSDFITHFCAGNNFGTIWYMNSLSFPAAANFRQGSHWDNTPITHFSSLVIDGYIGTQKCPANP